MPELPPRKAHPHPAKPPLPDAKLRKPGHLRRSKARGGAPGLQMRGGASRSVTHFACKRGRTDEADAAPPPAAPAYAELQCITNFSFQRGASHADELVARAAELGYAALAITDQSSLAGVVRAHVAAKETGLKLVIGAAVFLQDAPPVLLWVSDRAAYSQLTLLITKGRRAAPKGECRLRFDDVAGHSAGLLAGVLLERATVADLCRYREVFGDRCYAVAELHRGPNDRRLLERMAETARTARVPLVA